MTPRTLQFDHDVTEIVDAYAAGGEGLAASTFAAICMARRICRWEAHMLAQTAHETITERNPQ